MNSVSLVDEILQTLSVSVEGLSCFFPAVILQSEFYVSARAEVQWTVLLHLAIDLVKLSMARLKAGLCQRGHSEVLNSLLAVALLEVSAQAFLVGPWSLYLLDFLAETKLLVVW